MEKKLQTIKERLLALSLAEVIEARIVETRTVQEYKDGQYVEVGTKKEVLRPFINNGRLCYYAKGSNRRGYLYELKKSTVDIELKLPTEKAEDRAEKQWYKGIKNFIKRTDKSGLWPELNMKAKLSHEIGYRKLQQAKEAYDKNEQGLSYEENDKKRVQDVKAIDPRLVSVKPSYKVGEKEYPEYEAVDTDILWHLAYIPKIKKMNFGKYINSEKLQQIREAMRDKRPLYVSGRTSYDVSLEYKSESNKAWYSEEFKNCGNGHYYLALDHTHAWFYEND